MAGWVQFTLEAHNGYRCVVNLPPDFSKEMDYISQMTMTIDGAPIVSVPFQFHPGAEPRMLHTLCRYNDVDECEETEVVLS